jgi:hypothetical protein
MQYATRLRYIANTSPDKLYQEIEMLPNMVEIKNVMLGRDGRWYCWFTIPNQDSGIYNKKGKK